MVFNEQDQMAVNTIRSLAIDMVEKANSGHPGLPLGVAPMAYVLWSRFLKQNPHHPSWENRDRFVLSAGHGSALLYALLHLFDFGLSMDELKQFRQYGSKTPGHPEYGHTVGIETTTGPLGQGFANGVGMALAEAHLAAQYNKDGLNLIDHNTYAIVSDGDLMEGISSEAGSLAGHMGLGKLIYLYDDNHISIEGDTSLAFGEDVEMRFKSYGWQVLRVADGNDLESIASAIETAKKDQTRPSLIMVRTILGYGSPNKQNKSAAHGSPLGPEELLATKKNLGWPYEEPFTVPESMKQHFASLVAQGQHYEEAWHTLRASYQKAQPALFAAYEASMSGKLPDDAETAVTKWEVGDKAIATRSASGKVLESLAKVMPSLFGGSADLASSNMTHMAGRGDFSKETPTGANLHFGVREHAMGSMLNGMALHGGVFPYGGTFLVFSDYMRPAMRLAALMGVRVVYVLTHDSIGLGEDGPTHQPVEHLAALRLIPGLTVMRPADANETAYAWLFAAAHQGPTVLALSRQNLPILKNTSVMGVAKGGYALRSSKEAKINLVASGSEVALIQAAADQLATEGILANVVSMPAIERYLQQAASYKQEVIPQALPTLAIEMASTLSWLPVVGCHGKVLGIDRFGASGPAEVLFEKFGFTVDHVVTEAKELLG